LEVGRDFLCGSIFQIVLFAGSSQFLLTGCLLRGKKIDVKIYLYFKKKMTKFLKKSIEVEMNLVQAGYEILYILASADDKITTPEINVIKTFLKQNFTGEFDVVKDNQLISILDFSALMVLMVDAAVFFNKNCNQEGKELVLDFALRLIKADEEITEKEKELFIRLGNEWKINMEEFLNKRLKKN